VGAESGDFRPAPDDLVLAWCVAAVDRVVFEEIAGWTGALAADEVTPGSAQASPAAAMTLAVVADNATYRTRARPRSLAATSDSWSRSLDATPDLLSFMASRMGDVVLPSRWETSEAAMNLGYEPRL
jgi:hypothetical protein